MTSHFHAEITPGVFDATTLSEWASDSSQAIECTTSDWWEGVRLWPSEKESGMGNWGEYYQSVEVDNHPLCGNSDVQELANLLSGGAHDRTIRQLALITFQVGQVIDPKRKDGLHKWEKSNIAQFVDKLQIADHNLPNTVRNREDCEKLYVLARNIQRLRLAQIVEKLGLVISNFQEDPVTELFVAIADQGRIQTTARRKIMPLVGISIGEDDTNFTSELPSKVLPVVSDIVDHPPLIVFKKENRTANIYTRVVRNND